VRKTWSQSLFFSNWVKLCGRYDEGAGAKVLKVTTTLALPSAIFQVGGAVQVESSCCPLLERRLVSNP
jgi:hypothetical protein